MVERLRPLSFPELQRLVGLVEELRKKQ